MKSGMFKASLPYSNHAQARSCGRGRDSVSAINKAKTNLLLVVLLLTTAPGSTRLSQDIVEQATYTVGQRIQFAGEVSQILSAVLLDCTYQAVLRLERPLFNAAERYFFQQLVATSRCNTACRS